ncbi:MAG: hypothetical protein ACI4W6_02350, partial [Acutalibacteraceae bacterium]
LDPTSFFEKKLGKKLYSYRTFSIGVKLFISNTQFPSRRKCKDCNHLPPRQHAAVPAVSMQAVLA